MLKGSTVTWTLKDGSKGRGFTISNESEGHVLVAVEPENGEEFHRVIYCAVTWLTVVEPVNG